MPHALVGMEFALPAKTVHPITVMLRTLKGCEVVERTVENDGGRRNFGHLFVGRKVFGQGAPKSY